MSALSHGSDPAPTLIRRRKMRCDGAKPSCAQCIRAERGDECEYDDGLTKSATQMLYERLAMLEKRFRELQAAKRPVRARRSSPCTRASSDPSSTNANVTRSNSAPGRVHSLPGVNGNAAYDQNLSGSSTMRREWRQSLPSNSDGLGAPGFGSNFASMDNLAHTPYFQSMDASSPSMQSRLSPSSGRSTPSSSEFSHNELTVRPIHREASQIQNNATSRLNMGYSYDSAHRMKLGLPSPGSHSEVLKGNVEMLPTDPSNSSSTFQAYTILHDRILYWQLLAPNQSSEIPTSIMEQLMDTFFAHSQQVGITILAHNIVNLSCVLTSSLSSSASCLTDCVLLWGAHFSPNEAVHTYKEHFLRSALAALPSLLSEPLAIAPEFKLAATSAGLNINSETVGMSGYNVMVATAASTMLATYFFAEGRALEGSYHANMASQLAICAGLHRTPDPRTWQERSIDGIETQSNVENVSLASQPRDTSSNSQTNQASPSAELLPPPSCQYHAFERQHTLWNAFVLDRAWSAAGRLPTPSSRWSVGSQDIPRNNNALKETDPRTAITTPWPEDWGLFIVGESEWSTHAAELAPPGYPVEEFLTGIDVRPPRSILELRAKSATLFEAASRISSLSDSNNPKPQQDSSVTFLQHTISTFLRALTPLPAHDFRPASFAKCSPYTSHTLTHAAMIRLHFRLAEKAYTTFSPHSLLPKGSSMQMIRDGLLGYDRMLLQWAGSDQPGHRGCSPGESVGKMRAAVDLCLSSARATVRIARSLVLDDYVFLEPIIAPCWSLASEVLLLELGRFSVSSQHPESANLLSELRSLETSLKYLGRFFPIGNIEARRLTSTLSQVMASG
ncbi:uncharacterized protein FOMMEDRAFT_164753 [Fomitiporia mediterranea MF3/22]|uniref:uncharacterized protein n=1 Tax=Fomitiporia mediterranea (strain MF3/22) TaxID=694068 RepID=UPI0004408B93|nr:uncharacterized protein FOMMEDRAFT_164753 [Fomitiporia mediterranea MF3/22]EJD07944.1 hypothetical protein FOMMEDRAFT_164753 [Fomitiporia mediterranea MF3/22]